MKEAEGLYRDGISHLDTVKTSNDEITKLKIILFQNLCVCLNSSGDFKDSIHNATLALKLDPNAVKALYLRGVAFLKSKQFEDAS